MFSLGRARLSPTAACVPATHESFTFVVSDIPIAVIIFQLSWARLASAMDSRPNTGLRILGLKVTRPC